MIKATLMVLILAAAVSLTACPSYWSKPYLPPSPSGQDAFASAQKGLYPLQVKNDPARYSKEIVAWAGIVKRVELFQSLYGPALMVLIEHRYFDWIEDHGAQPEVYFWSPRGEGEFMIVVKPEKQMNEREVDQTIPVGTMAIAAGKIDVRSAGYKARPIALLTQYFQFIDRKWYRTDVFDYGRENEPIRKVKGGDFWKKYGPK